VIKDFVVIVKLSILSKLDSMLDKLRRIRQSIRPALEMLKLLHNNFRDEKRKGANFKFAPLKINKWAPLLRVK
jgi:hypothetical protein